MKSTTMRVPEGHGSVYKEVRFSPTSTPLRRAQSVSTSNPSLNSDYVRRNAGRPFSRNASVALSEYLDEARSFLESQRQQFENERALFAQERHMWESERQLLKSRIHELETQMRLMSERTSRRPASPFPIRSQFGAQVWEGSGVVDKPTRVFHDSDSPDGLLAPPLAEQAHLRPSMSLDAALSPKAQAADRMTAASVPVPIEKLDSKLDGITLKSTALPPDVVARVMTPPSPSSVENSPSPRSGTAQRPIADRRQSIKLKLSDLGPPQENLTRNAGHTPMAIIEADAELGQATASDGSPMVEEKPLGPVTTQVPQPVENSESYFPDVPEDPSLKGPLALLNDQEQDDGFLRELDQRLLEQARRVLSTSSETIPEAPEETDAASHGEGEREPELKFKKSTNFGTAFGQPQCGEV